MTKTCRTCKETKPLADYYKNRDARDGYRNRCKSCMYKDTVSTPDKKRQKALYQRRYKVMRRYGISLEEYELMLEAQGHVCAICGMFDRLGRNLSVDHNHKTGMVRKLLCTDCNFMVGHSLENPDVLEKAAEYLRGFQ